MVRGLGRSGGARGLRNSRINAGDAFRIGGKGLLLGAGALALASKFGNSVGIADPYSGASVLFPEDLIENDHWIEFRAKETKGRATDLLGIDVGTTIIGGTIRLPMPANLSTDYNPQYTEQDLSPMAGAVLKPFDRAMYGNRDLETEAQQGSGKAAVLGAITGGAAGAAVQTATAAAAGVAGAEGVNAALKVFGGIAVNPHKVVLFTGVGFRDHTFSWKLSPRNRRESNDIRLICEMFKFYSHPEYLAGGLFFKYPEFFDITFRHPSYLFELEPSVCTDVRIDYHGQGFPAYIRDADGSGIPAPAEITLSLTFKETEVITKNTLTRGFERNQPTPAPTPGRENIVQHTRADEVASTTDGFLPRLNPEQERR
jgi:hypothetical protein